LNLPRLFAFITAVLLGLYISWCLSNGCVFMVWYLLKHRGNFILDIMVHYIYITPVSTAVPRSRMRGAIPPQPHYAFMAWCSVKAQGQLYLYYPCFNSRDVSISLGLFHGFGETFNLVCLHGELTNERRVDSSHCPYTHYSARTGAQAVQTPR
jgi:hypothetical protein